MAERQKIIETNRSIRSIKNELESLLEKDIITYDSYTQIHSLLPTESPLNGTSAASTPSVPVAAKVASPAPPTAALNNLSLGGAPPPSYAQTTTAAPPALPTRNTPAPPPGKPILTHARALYRYAATDARDVSFEKDDRIAVHEYMNADWWMGRNERTGQEGIFPRTYVEAEPAASNGGYPNEKAAPYGQYAGGAPVQPQYSGYPPAPTQSNPYNASAPPMAVANEQTGGEGNGKGKEMGKKFGKKLGNAAIFGAGATIGSNIVNSIF